MDVSKLLVYEFVLVPLPADIGLELFVVFAGVRRQLQLDLLGFFNQHVDHHVDFLADLVCFFFEQLQRVVAANKVVLSKVSPEPNLPLK